MESACGFECPHLCWSDLGLTPGEKLLVEKGENGEVWLKPTERKPAEAVNGEESRVKMIEEDGFLVFAGIPPELLMGIVEREREARLDDLMKGMLP
jgi:hypothetical protein